MAFDFYMPDIGEGVVEGEIVGWKVKEGDRVKLDQPIVEVMTDKATVELPSPRAGVIANWDAIFASAATRGVAIEIDGDPARQDLDHTLASRAVDAGCIFALDSDAHTTPQLSYAETALAHARLAAIPADRIVNCWPLDRLMAWLSDPSSERRRL